MDNPLFGGYWGRVPERRLYQMPNYNYPNPYAATSYATPVKSKNTAKVKPKNVVEIPVNFVNSETSISRKAPAMDEKIAAVKIQAAFRGFSVRKSRPLNKLRVIMKTKAEAAEIRRRVNDEHVVELIRRDEKERVKMTEWIMSLLLRLDEIQGAIPFVRESRKVVIRELVILQETVDDIIAAKSRQDAANLKRNNVESPVLKADASPTIPCTEEGAIVGNSRNDENSSESLDMLNVQTMQPDVKVETADFMDREEAGDKLSEKVKSIEDIGVVREESEKLKRMVSDLLKKSEKQSEMIHDLSLRISKLEEQVSQRNKKKKVRDRKKSGAQANDRRRKFDRHSSNCFLEDWF